MHFHRRAKPTAAICHGPVAFLSLADKKDTTKPFAYQVSIIRRTFPIFLSYFDLFFQSYKMTAYTNTEEMVNEVSWGLHKLKIHVQSELEKHGARFQSAMIPMGSHVVVDRELVGCLFWRRGRPCLTFLLQVTGQNPASASALADAFLKKLDEKGGRRGSAGPAAMGKVVAVQGQPTQSMPGQTAAAV